MEPDDAPLVTSRTASTIFLLFVEVIKTRGSPRPWSNNNRPLLELARRPDYLPRSAQSSPPAPVPTTSSSVCMCRTTRRWFWFVFIWSLFQDSSNAYRKFLEILPRTKLRKVRGSSLQMNCTAKTTDPPDLMSWWVQRDHPDRSLPVKTEKFNDWSVGFTIDVLEISDAGAYICCMTEAGGAVHKITAVVWVDTVEMSGPCRSSQFLCTTGHCIAIRYRCNGVVNCLDGSDEQNCNDSITNSPTTKHPETELDGQTIWLRTAVYSVIGCTIGVVVLISVLVIAIFRIRMRRTAARRALASADRSYRSANQRAPTSSSASRLPAASTYDPFASSANSQFGNIIVNVNNGVQYGPGTEFTTFMEPPPPYSAVVTQREYSPPPPYSTIDRSVVEGHAENNNLLDSPGQGLAPLGTPAVEAGGGFDIEIAATNTESASLLQTDPNNVESQQTLPGHIVVKDGQIFLAPRDP